MKRFLLIETDKTSDRASVDGAAVSDVLTSQAPFFHGDVS